MNNKLLHTEVQEFISKNLNADSSRLLLKTSPFEGISSSELVTQIESKKRCRKKLPLWYNTPGIYYPPVISVEQASSEESAEYKSRFVKGEVLDLTGGFGVDDFYFSQRADKVYHFEIQEELSKIAAHNFSVFQTKNVQCFTQNGIDFLKSSTADKQWDWIYLDPARRNAHNNKVFLLSDCSPDVVGILPLLLQKAPNVLLKTSPMLDISMAVSQLRYVKAIHIVAVKNEVKELLWLLHREKNSDIQVISSDIGINKKASFSFYLGKQSSVSHFSKVQKYLYEPSAAVLKSGAFDEVSRQFSVCKLHRHSHLYTSEELQYFQGRTFKVKQVFPFSKKQLQQLSIYKANITTRNFPISVENIRKIGRIKEGGSEYLFFTTQPNDEKVIIHCEKEPSSLL